MPLGRTGQEESAHKSGRPFFFSFSKPIPLTSGVACNLEEERKGREEQWNGMMRAGKGEEAAVRPGGQEPGGLHQQAMRLGSRQSDSPGAEEGEGRMASGQAAWPEPSQSWRWYRGSASCLSSFWVLFMDPRKGPTGYQISNSSLTAAFEFGFSYIGFPFLKNNHF